MDNLPQQHSHTRRSTREVRIGDLRIGSSHPVLIQSMTVTNTLDTERVVAEIIELTEAGCPLVRLTVPSVHAAENLGRIRDLLNKRRVRVALAADIHFTPAAAMIAADHVDKVRINPGNFAERPGSGRVAPEVEVTTGASRVEERFLPLARKLKEKNVALRIGINHGSLSERMLSRFGDTPEGMVESALEYVRLCRSEDFHQIVLSMKSSIPAVTVAAYRLLVERMDSQGMDYPLHLGLTEAGDGLDGRIKSAVAIGALLADGIGDTIRVSLTEDSRHEIPAARALLDAVARERAGVESSAARTEKGCACRWAGLPVPTRGERQRSRSLRAGSMQIGGTSTVRVELRLVLDANRRLSDGFVQSGADGIREVWLDTSTGPIPELISIRPHASVPNQLILEELDLIRRSLSVDTVIERPAVFLEWNYARQSEIHFLEAALQHVDGVSLRLTKNGPDSSATSSRITDNHPGGVARSTTSVDAEHDPGLQPLLVSDYSGSSGKLRDESISLLARLVRRHSKPVRWRLGIDTGDAGETAARLLALFLREDWPEVGFLCEPGSSWIPRVRALSRALGENAPPIFLEVPAVGPDPAFLAGSVLTDGLGDCICLTGPGTAWPAGPRPQREEPVAGAFAVLQACRLRMTRAEIIACPSCGRTLFDLQNVTARVRERLGHLPGVKIAVMGCIVNGPGEMADADFGYVGSGPGLVDLYAGRNRIRCGIPEEEATDRLAELIRQHGRWTDPA